MRKRGETRRAHSPNLITKDENDDPIHTAITPYEKVMKLAEKFFPLPRQADPGDNPGYGYPEPLECPDITRQELNTAILKLRNKKAPGADRITHETLKLVLPTIAAIMTNRRSIS
jgi:hypothetical protein